MAPATDEPARPENLRAHNLTLTFQRIIRGLRTHLARRTGHRHRLTRHTVSRIVDDLIAGA
jgi:hypothetical protein